MLPQVIGDTCELIKRLDHFKVREASRTKEKDELPSVKAELEEARRELSTWKDRQASWAEKEKKLNADLTEARERCDTLAAERDSAREDAKTSRQQQQTLEAEVKNLKADREVVEAEAISRFKGSDEFSRLQNDYAVDWVIDCVAQCRRLCREKFGSGSGRFLRDEDVVRAVQSKRNSPPAEDEEDDDDASDEDLAAVPSQPTSAPTADLSSGSLPADMVA